MTTALEGGEGSASPPGRSLSPGKTRYPLYRRLSGPSASLDRCGKSRPPPGFDPRTIQPVASRYTNWATGPTYNFHNATCIIPSVCFRIHPDDDPQGVETCSWLNYFIKSSLMVIYLFIYVFIYLFLILYFNCSHPVAFSTKYSKSKFSQNATYLLSNINVATCFDS